MFTQRQGWRIVVLFVCLSVSGLQSALAVTPEDEFDKRIRTSREIQPLGDKPFGEEISLYNGALTFRQVDIDQPGIGLPIQLIRTFDPSDSSSREGTARAFADWRLELPSIQTLTTNENQFFRGDRCTNFAKAPAVVLNVGRQAPVIYTAEQWWGGYQLIIPGMGRQDLLRRDSSNTLSPRMKDASGNQMSFPIVTRQHWMVTCLAQTSNGQGGQGFLVVSPDGTKYWMDWLIYRGYDNVGFAQPGFGGVARQMAMMMTSRIEDRFGNSLSYQYDANGNLVKIQSSDGRSLILNYETWTGNNTSDVGSRITTATLQASDAPSRTWSYSYATLSDSKVHLTSAILPDGSSWAMDVSGLARFSDLSTITYDAYDGCSSFSYRQSGGSANISLKHPSGLIGNFSVGTLIRGRSYVPFLCDSSSPGKLTLEIPNITKGINILSERISGPGVSEQTWTYSYSAPQGSWAKDCASGCATTVWTDLKSPTGAASRYTFSNRYDSTESQLLSTEIYDGAVGSTLLRREDSTYASPSAGPWPKVIGSVLLDNINNAQVGTISPVSGRAITESGSSYNYKATSFDVFGRMSAANRYSPWHQRSDRLDYSDNYEKWILGQVAKRTNSDTGLVESQVDYDPVTGLPAISYEYGKLRQKFYYNSDGTLSSSVDGANNSTSFSNWKRGVPTSIRFADGAAISANVNDYGWITSVTDESGATTGYSYDVMGRLTSVTYPTGDSQNWNTTTATFEQVGSSEYGLPAGHWRQTTATGNARKVLYFDGFLRPIVTYEYDAGNPGATGRYQRFSYDYKGRVAFASFAGTTDALSTGTRTQYDTLGRTTSVSLDSELGTLTTLTEYLAGNQTRVTDPRGNRTVAGYQVFDQPDYKTPVWIQHPEGATTEINRDIFGKPLSIRRHDANGTVAVTRSYVYDTYQQLCKTVEPETGATANGYDAAGNLVWSAAGLSLPSTTSCDADSAFASGRRVDRSYDVRNRIKALSFPDGNGNQAWSYWPDGAVKQITTTNNGVATYNSYAYNKRRLLIAESQGQADGETWALGYAYDANGNLAAHRYPSGQTVDYAPNALGQPTQAGSYATGVSYYPNGAIKQFTYGNGIVHTLTQNARQLPDTSQDAYGGTAFLSDGYDYDANGNVAAISDGATGRNQRGNRTMTYDGLDRLTKAESPMFGTATYSYDVLDNLTHVVAPGRDHYYCYDANWQLTNVKTGSCGGSTVIGMSYDPQGNLSNKNGQAFVFDYGNRLRQATGKETYRYDGNGRRTLALQSAGNIGSLYDQSGALRFQKNQRQSKSTDYILLGGSLVAEADWPLGQLASVKDYVNWNPVSGATRYVVEESVDGVTWTSVYEGSQGNWTSLARPAGTYSYRVTACTADGNCTAVSNVTHDQRPAVDIVPLLYQLLLND
ncbi:RHS repeat protein [Xanthomonas sp. LF06-19]|uniref:RHS repeat domain-containing protein n=1 Tax=Xanthomonas sp. LF06-19 TaxID=3097551 RepID=UPI002A83B8D9|nr:RHS repeat protein [Xanthomonas sp. LF06-19]MDY4282975.1 RHS repeat protein [Xanthomonas sp. LF06-19]